ncbi:MAG TPA: hypothetical protein VGP07_03825 [Polyangia bacterium]|jgi:hypothetical protein
MSGDRGGGGSSRRVGSALMLSLALGVSRAALASAATPPPSEDKPVLLLTGATDGLLARRLRAELTARGFATTSASSCTSSPSEPLVCDPSSGASGDGVLAILRLQMTPARIEIFLRETRGNALRARDSVEGSSADDMTLPVRAAEDLRALLASPSSAAVFTQAPVPLASPLPPPSPAGLTLASSDHGEPPAPNGAASVSEPVIVRTASPQTRASVPVASRYALGVDGTLLWPRSGTTTGFASTLHARYNLLPHFGVGARFVLPFVDPTVSRQQGRATVSPVIAALEGRLGIGGLSSGSAWEGGLSAGLGLVWLRTDGAADPSWLGRRDDTSTRLALVSLDAGRWLGPRVRLRAAATMGEGLPSVTVRFVDQSVATWGRAFLAFDLGAEASF